MLGSKFLLSCTGSIRNLPGHSCATVSYEKGDRQCCPFWSHQCWDTKCISNTWLPEMTLPALFRAIHFPIMMPWQPVGTSWAWAKQAGKLSEAVWTWQSFPTTYVNPLFSSSGDTATPGSTHSTRRPSSPPPASGVGNCSSDAHTLAVWEEPHCPFPSSCGLVWISSAL